MGSRILSHQLSNGLYVSGRPEQVKDRQPTMASRAVPYTGGDIKRSGELGKMFEVSHSDQALTVPPTLKTSRPSSSSSQLNSGPVRSGASSGQLQVQLVGTNTKSSGSGPILPRRLSGPMTPLQPTGLITSGPLGSSSSSAGRRSAQLDPSLSTGKAVYGSAVTHLTEEMKIGFKLSKPVMWVFVVVMFMAVLVGAFLAVAVKKTVILIVIAGVIGLVIMSVVWNCSCKKMGLLGFLKKYPDADLRGAIDGQLVKVTGVVTCGSIPLESSFQKTQRCVYVSTQLYEYKGCSSKSTIPRHHFFSWGCRHSERHVADFYISDFQTGLRALVKAGYGAKASVLVEPTKIVDVTKENQDLSPSFLKWLSDRSLSSDNRTMRLKEGYIKEGSTVSVIGVVRRHENVLMIVPPSEPISTGFQWRQCLLSTYVEGLVLTCNESQNNTDVIPV